MEIAASHFDSSPPLFGSGAFWRENMEHLVEEMELAQHDGRTSASQLHNITAVELAVALSKSRTTAG